MFCHALSCRQAGAAAPCESTDAPPAAPIAPLPGMRPHVLHSPVNWVCCLSAPCLHLACTWLNAPIDLTQHLAALLQCWCWPTARSGARRCGWHTATGGKTWWTRWWPLRQQGRQRQCWKVRGRTAHVCERQCRSCAARCRWIAAGQALALACAAAWQHMLWAGLGSAARCSCSLHCDRTTGPERIVLPQQTDCCPPADVGENIERVRKYGARLLQLRQRRSDLEVSCSSRCPSISLVQWAALF